MISLIFRTKLVTKDYWESLGGQNSLKMIIIFCQGVNTLLSSAKEKTKKEKKKLFY